MNPQDRHELFADLASEMENAQIHHPQRDADWIRPADLRRILRSVYQVLMDLAEVDSA